MPGHRVGCKLKAADVIDVLADLFIMRGVPGHIRSDNESEFTGHLLDLWAYRNNVRIDFSRPCKPTDNA